LCKKLFCGIYANFAWFDGKLDGYNGELDINISYHDYPEIIKNAGLNGFKKPDIPKFDIDGDGKVTSYDAPKILQNIADEKEFYIKLQISIDKLSYFVYN